MININKINETPLDINNINNDKIINYINNYNIVVNND